MARVTNSDVNDIWTNDLDTAALDEFIDMANRLVDRELSGTSATAGEKEDIELLLAVHFARMEQPPPSRVGDVGLAIPDDLSGLRETPQGRRAIMIDPTGNLAAAAKERAVLRSFGPTHRA